jgi:S1-C subfamily serine protease
VLEILKGGAGEAEGLSRGDYHVITSVAGQDVGNAQDINRILNESGTRSIDVDFYRDTKGMALTVKPQLVKTDVGFP